jgi:hypothetical protein
MDGYILVASALGKINETELLNNCISEHKSRLTENEAKWDKPTMVNYRNRHHQTAGEDSVIKLNNKINVKRATSNIYLIKKHK